MSHELIIALVVFATAALFTPGPNNIMLMTSGLNFGFQRTLPHLLGVCIGFLLLFAVIGFGLGAVFAAYPVLQTVLKYAGAAYLIFLAVRIARSRPATRKDTETSRPMTFTGAVLFQWVNIKAWITSIGTVTTYAAVAPYPYNIGLQSLVMLVVEIFSTLGWVLLGTSLQAVIRDERAVRVFNIGMAMLLIASLYPVFRQP